MSAEIKIITQDFFPIEGGITTWVYRLALNLRKLDNSVEIITREWSGREYNDAQYPFPVHRLPDENWKSRKYFRIYKYLQKIADGKEPPVFICANWKMAIPLWWFNSLRSAKKKFPFIIIVHGLDAFERRSFNEWMMRKTLNSASYVVSGARNVAQIVSDEHGYSREIPIINYGVDTDIFKPMNVEREFFEKYKIPQDKKILLSLGRLVERKGFDNVLKSLPAVIEKFDNFIYLIAGRGRYEPELRKIADKSDLSDKVKFLGFVPDEDVPKMYNIADVFAMPSREIGTDIEGFGITYLEANACKKPVIAGDSGGVPDAVENGLNGILIPPEDIGAIADAIIKLLTDEIFAKKLGEQGYERVHEKFLWSMTAEKFLNLIEKIV